jgi:transcriptional regulator with GAF, ATPase, and Fis domain
MMTGGLARRAPRADILQQPFSPQDLLRRVRVQLALIQTRHELGEENLRIHRELDSHLRSKLAIDCLSSELSAGVYPEHIAGTSSAAARLTRADRMRSADERTSLDRWRCRDTKEMAARAIHNRSDRRERPFIKLNCAALARDLIQQELYGVDRAGVRQLCG